jgi:hypothetical protein
MGINHIYKISEYFPSFFDYDEEDRRISYTENLKTALKLDWLKAKACGDKLNIIIASSDRYYLIVNKENSHILATAKKIEGHFE